LFKSKYYNIRIICFDNQITISLFARFNRIPNKFLLSDFINIMLARGLFKYLYINKKGKNIVLIV